MKSILTSLLIIIGFSTFAQKVTIQGIAVDTTNGLNGIIVSVNDTLRRYNTSRPEDYSIDTWNEIRYKYTVFTNPPDEGKFSIEADLSDSLTFYSQNFFERFIPQTHAVKDLLELDEIRIELEPEVCIEYEECEEDRTVYAFVGEVLEVNEVDEIYYCGFLSLDAKYEAKLRIIEEVYGNYPKDTISFFSYVHSRRLGFDRLKHVLIYVSESCGVNYHAKYLYNPVYRVDDEWKVVYRHPNGYVVDSLLAEKAKPLKFSDSVYTDFGNRFTDEELQKKFPEPYFYRKGSYIKPMYGYDPEDVFEVMKKTKLKEYGWFKD
jgi:hypothetical protein